MKISRRVGIILPFGRKFLKLLKTAISLRRRIPANHSHDLGQVLFVWMHIAGRSQTAEALARSEGMNAVSAGITRAIRSTPWSSR